MSELNPKPMEALEILPPECWQSAFNHLDDDGLEAVSLVCKDFLAISKVCKDSLQVVHPGIGKLSEHLKRFKQLKRIDLSHFKGNLNEAILEIAHSEVSLDVLDISCQCYFEVEKLKELDSNSKMKNLKVLNCKGVQILDDNELVGIANFFRNLEQLKVGNPYLHRLHSKFLTGSGVEFLASKLKLLKKIHMFGLHYFSDESLLALSLNCAFLKAVKIYNCDSYRCDDGVTEKGIGILLRNSPNLEALSIGHIKLGSSQSAITLANSVSHAKSLNSLTFHKMDVSDKLLNAIANANLRLKKFGLKRCRNFTVKGLLMVLSCNYITKLRIIMVRASTEIEDEDMKLLLNGDVSNLTHLDIGCFKVKNSTLSLLNTKCPSLIEIRVRNAKVFKGDKFNIPFSRNHNVQNLCLKYSQIDDESVQQFALLFPNLRVLDLTDCSGLTNTSIEAILKSCKFIRKLILKCYLEAKLVKDDSEFPLVINLEDLDLSWSSINDEGLSAIAEKCPRLASLNVGFCRNVTVEGINYVLRKVTTLKCINIRPHYDGLTQLEKFQKYFQLRDWLEWMLTTDNFVSLKKIYLYKYDFTEEDEEIFLQRGCLLLGEN